MSHVSLLHVLPLLVLLGIASLSSGDDNPGTTVHLKEIFLGRCYDYKQVKYQGVLPTVSEECESLYSKFFNAFSYRPPCALDMRNYLPFMSAASQVLPEGKALFWSGQKQIAEEYGSEGHRYVTLADTLVGYSLDGLVWCGQSIDPGLNYSRCPSFTDCPSEAGEAFWAAASQTFASSARGDVTVMLDGGQSGRPAYRRDSFFGKHELPSLKKDVVKNILVLLIHPLETPPVESCTNGSLLLMKEDVTARGFNFRCEDDPQAIIHLLCVDDPSDRECRLASKHILQQQTRLPSADRRVSALRHK